MATLKNSKNSASNTGYKGIYYRATTDKYEAQVSVCTSKTKQEFSKVHVGIYSTLKEAIKARLDYIETLA